MTSYNCNEDPSVSLGNIAGATEYALSPNLLLSTACHERPQQRLERFGASALSDTELLAILLRSGTRGNDVLTLAMRLLAEAGSLSKLVSWVASDFRRIKGIGPVKAHQLVAVMEMARRVMASPISEQPLLTRADLVAAYPATAALAHPREVFRAAIREAASALVCAHNHPSGDPAPSSADLQITHMLREAAKTVEITLIDHVIIGRAGADPLGRGYYSFRDSGLI